MIISAMEKQGEKKKFTNNNLKISINGDIIEI